MDGVAVRRGARDLCGRGVAARAADVLDIELLAERSESFCATMRPITSLGPPAAKPTTTRTGLFG